MEMESATSLKGTCIGSPATASLVIRQRPRFHERLRRLLASPQGQMPVVFKDSDGGGLNDCEKRLLGGRLDRWDSNGDWIPDCLEFFRGMNFIAGTHQENADPF